MIRVLIADDHPLQRKMLTMLLSEAEDIVVVGEAESGEEVLRKADGNDIDIITLDISLPKKNGIEVLRELRSCGNKIPVLILSNYSREDYEAFVMAAGASGYLAKEDVPEKFIEAVRACIPDK